MRRRAFVASALLVPLCSAAAEPARNAGPVRLGLTPVFLDDQVGFLKQWRAYLERKLERELRFVQRGNYREIMELLLQDKLDFAWICGYPYVRHRGDLRLLAVPVFRGKPLYQSYLIVPAADERTKGYADLRGKVFAFSDPDSNSGFLYPNFVLRQTGERSREFFARTFFTWAHRKVVEAVAVSLAQAGAVDGYVWETLRLLHPELTARTRVIERSPEFGFPPFAARRSLPKPEFDALRRALLGMAGDAEGARLLKELNLDGFDPGEPRLFDGIAHMAQALARDRPGDRR